MPLTEAVSLVADAVVSAGGRGVPLAGMKLDYDLTMVETQAVRLCGGGIVERGWCGPVLDAGVINRHFDRERRGRRTLVDLCGHYGIEIAHAHERISQHDRVHGGALGTGGAARGVGGRYDLARLHEDQIDWHREWAQEYDGWRLSKGMIPIDPLDYEWPLVPATLSPAA